MTVAAQLLRNITSLMRWFVTFRIHHATMPVPMNRYPFAYYLVYTCIDVRTPTVLLFVPAYRQGRSQKQMKINGSSRLFIFRSFVCCRKVGRFVVFFWVCLGFYNRTDENTVRSVSLSVSRRHQPDCQYFEGFGVNMLLPCDDMIDRSSMVARTYVARVLAVVVVNRLGKLIIARSIFCFFAESVARVRSMFFFFHTDICVGCIGVRGGWGKRTIKTSRFFRFRFLFGNRKTDYIKTIKKTVLSGKTRRRRPKIRLSASGSHNKHSFMCTRYVPVCIFLVRTRGEPNPDLNTLFCYIVMTTPIRMIETM